MNPKEDSVAMDEADGEYSYGISSLSIIIISMRLTGRFLKGYKTVGDELKKQAIRKQ